MRCPSSARSFSLRSSRSAAIAAGTVHAAPCVGFTDVDDSSAFCKNIEWLKNRAITLGCTSSTLYCPTQVVTRLSMAAFLNRLGDALTPVHLKTETSGNAFDLDVDTVICETADHTVAGAARTAHGNAVLEAGQGAGPMDIAVRYVESTNSGASWTPVSPIQAASADGNVRQAINAILPPRDLVIGTTYRYALRVSRVAGSATTGDVGNYLCSVRVTLENRNPATSPLDPQD